LTAQRRYVASTAAGHLSLPIEVFLRLTVSRIRVRNQEPFLSVMIRIVALPALWTNCLRNERYEVIDAVGAARFTIGIAFPRPRQMGVNVLAPQKKSQDAC